MGHLKGLLERLSGYKTFLGWVVVVVGTAIAWMGGDLPLVETVYTQLVAVFGLEPLSKAQMVMLAGELKMVIGLLDKARKAIKGKPQIPEIQSKPAASANGLPLARVK